MNDASQLIPLIEADLDDQTYVWAMDGSATPTTLYKKMVKSISAIDRENPRLCGLYSIPSMRITFLNGDQFMSQLKAAQPWRGRTVRALYGDPELGFASFNPAYTGVVSDWSFHDDECTWTIADNSLDRFNVPITKYLRRIVAGGYPLAVPSYAQGNLIPWVGGSVQASGPGDNAGQLPAYCIDAAAFTYVACYENDRTIDSVYVYGALKTLGADYTVSSFTATGGENFTTIVFAADPRDFLNHSDLEIEVTWCGGTTEHRPIYLLEAFLLERAGFTSDELDSTSWDLVKAEFDARGYVGTLVVTKPEFTIGDVIGRFLQSFGLRFFKGRDGLWALDFIGLSKTPVLALTEKNIVVGSFQQRSYVAGTLASRIHFNYNYNYRSPGNEFFGHTPDLISAAEAVNLGGDLPYNLSLWFGRSLDGDAGTPQSIAALILALMRESGIVVEFEIPVRLFSAIELGDVVTLTHWEGVGTSGFSAKRIVVLQTRLVPSPGSSQLVLIGYVEPSTAVDLAAAFEFAGGVVVEELVAT